jgi:glycosyltransferase involved in cell wall biosynthesis
MARKILFYTDSVNVGGTEQVLLTLLGSLERKHWRPTLAFHDTPALASFVAAVAEREVELWPIPPLPEGWLGARRVPEFAHALRLRRIDVFHAHRTWPLSCKYALVAAVLAGIRAVVATTHLFVELPYTLSQRLQQHLLAQLIDRSVAVSTAVAVQLRQSFLIPNKKMQMIHNGIDTTRFTGQRNLELRRQLCGEYNRPIVLTPARLDKQKGHAYLLQAAAMLPNVTFVLAGDGPERASLHAKAHALGLDKRVIFLGHRNDIGDLLMACDVCVLPSLYEGLPISLLEAMAANTPVIATAVGGTPELITHNNTGLLVKPGNVAALAQAITTLLAEPQRAQQYAKAARGRVEGLFSATSMVKQTTTLYDELLNDRAK